MIKTLNSDTCVIMRLLSENFNVCFMLVKGSLNYLVVSLEQMFICLTYIHNKVVTINVL